MTTQFSLTTTLNRIYACKPCSNGWKKGLKAAGKTQADDEPLTYEQILDAVGIKDALWCCRAEPQHARLWRLYAVWCARQVQHLMTDERSIAALDVAERHANGQATDNELAAASAAASDATLSATEAATLSATEAAALSAAAAAEAAARAAAAEATARALFAALFVARDARALSAALFVARDAQTQAFRQLVTTGTLP